MSTVDRLCDAVSRGNADDVLALIEAGLKQGVAARTLLDDGLLHGMTVLGERFSNNEVWVPEVIIAARALNRGMEYLKPELIAAGVPSRGKVVIGTVEGDLHDIGKNLVRMMLQGSGFDVVDLGVNVPDARFVEAVRSHEPDVLCLSALLTTTREQLESVIDAVSRAGLRDKVTILVGGAPVSHEFAMKIGADGFAHDAASAAELVSRIVAQVA